MQFSNVQFHYFPFWLVQPLFDQFVVRGVRMFVKLDGGTKEWAGAGSCRKPIGDVHSPSLNPEITLPLKVLPDGDNTQQPRSGRTGLDGRI